MRKIVYRSVRQLPRKNILAAFRF